MTNDDTEFLNHIWHVLGYDNSEGAPPIHEQFYQRHKSVFDTIKPHRTERDKMKSMTDEQRKEYFKQKNRERWEREKRKRLR